MGDNKPECHSHSLQVWETAQWERECQHLARKGLWSQVGGRQTKPSVQQGRATAAGDKGDQRGVEQHSGVQSLAVSAVVWNLPHLYLESVYSTLLGLFNKCLDTPDSKCGISPGAYLWMVLL